MTLTEHHATVVDQLRTTGTTVVAGPPLTVSPAGPCYVVDAPRVLEVLGAGPVCRVTASGVDVLCVPPTGTDLPALLTLADTAIAALGAAVTGGQTEPSPFTDVDDVWCYRLTLEL